MFDSYIAFHARLGAAAKAVVTAGAPGRIRIRSDRIADHRLWKDPPNSDQLGDRWFDSQTSDGYAKTGYCSSMAGVTTS